MLLACFLGYLVILILMANFLSRRMTGLTDFFLAGRSLPGAAITLTFVAAWFGAGSTIGTMNQAFDKGISAIWLIAIPTLITCNIVSFLFSRKVRNFNSLSLPECIEKQYGPSGSVLLAWTILAATTTLIASQLVAAGSLLEVTMGLSPELSVSLIMAAVIIYSVIGGFRAVVMTDIFQFFGFTLALLILFYFTVFSPGHPHPLVPVPKEFWNPFFDWQKNLAMVFTFVLAWSIAPEMWQRMSSTKTAADAQKSSFWAGLLLTGLYGLVISTGLFAIYHLGAGDDHFAKTNVLLSLALTLPSPILTAIVLVGVLSAITSTIDSSLNVGSLTLSQDIIHRHLWPSATSSQLVSLSRITTAVIGLPAVCIALQYQKIIEILWISADIYASTMFIPILGLFYAPNSGRKAGILAICFGAIPVFLNFVRDFYHIVLPHWWPAWPYTTLLGVTLSLCGFCLGLLLRPPEAKSLVDSLSEESLPIKPV